MWLFCIENIKSATTLPSTYVRAYVSMLLLFCCFAVFIYFCTILMTLEAVVFIKYSSCFLFALFTKCLCYFIWFTAVRLCDPNE